MPVLSAAGVILAAYLAAGRTGTIAACLLMGISAWQTLIIAFLMDIAQIPVYGHFLEAGRRHIVLPQRLRTWLEARARRLRRRLQERRFRRWRTRLQPLAVVAVSGIPLRGFGIFSACILAMTLGYGRLAGTMLIMAGSLSSTVVCILLFLFPARWIHGL